MKHSFKVILGVLLIVGVLLAACAPAATPAAPVVQTVVVTKEVEKVVTQEVVKTVEVQATPAPDRIPVYWYIGLGAGSQPAQIPLEKAFADKYNKSQDKIQLIPIIVDNKYARDNLTAQLAAGNAPDIVGPVGTAGRAAFPGQWANLEPLMKSAGYDPGDIDPAFLNFYKVEGKLEGLPFAIYPSAVFVNKDLFKEAGLNLPPQKVGDPYVWPDGTKEEWNFDTVAKVARKLTIDKNGNDATSPNFDKNNIVQWGFNAQWNDGPGLRSMAAFFCPNYPVGPDGKALIPDCQVEAAKWFYDGYFGKQPFIPNQAAIQSDLLKGNEFGSGKVAMALTHTWYTCCIDPKVIPNLDAAIAPSYNGKTTAKMHGDTFAIMAQSKNPDAAFEVYKYMLNEGAKDLYSIYGGLPAKKSDQADYLKSLTDKFGPVDWQVFLDMIPFMDVPNHELGLPNNAKSNDALAKFWSDLMSNPKLNVDQRIQQLIDELNKDYAEAVATPTPTP
ncbi:MAG TPA: extracellular solute-binding protein [Anaerolineae bacterium]|nr:extracellular solute-binding protein [Anaerolineae bacterium]